MLRAQKSGTLEIVREKDGGWWYDLQTGTNSITPNKPQKTRTAAIHHAQRAAKEHGIHISKIEDAA